MKRAVTMFLSVSFLFCGAAAAQEKDAQEAKKIIRRAIRAAGGAEALQAHNSATFKEKGTYYGMGEGLPYTGVYAVQWPNKFRMEIEGVFTMVINGDKGWVNDPGGTREISGDELKYHTTSHYVGWVSSLLPIRKKPFTLTVLDETKVGERAVVGVKVSNEGHPDVCLYFDKQTNLLAKAEFSGKTAEGADAKFETLYSGYKAISDAKLATKFKMHQDGKVLVEAETYDYKAVDKHADGVFSKPK